MKPAAKQSRREGYALLLALFFTAVLALSISALTRRSLSLALRAREMETALQTEWGFLSLEAALGERGPGVLAASLKRHLAWEGDDEDERPEALRKFHGEFPLGPGRVKLVFSSEQHKMHLGELLARDGPGAVQEFLGDTLSGHSGLPPLRVRPYPKIPGLEVWPSRFSELGQIFSRSSAESLGVFKGESPSPLDWITLWGSGKLHFPLARWELIERQLKYALSAKRLRELTELREKGEVRTVSDVIRTFPLAKKERFLLTQLLTDRATSFSLWVRIRLGAGEETRLFAFQGGAKRAERELTFLGDPR